MLQEREFERVGGGESIRTDIRLIAATNKNLESAIAAGTFREDLYYRLNVIPILLPPLRDRLEDIPALVRHFVDKVSTRLGRKPPEPAQTILHDLMAYDWPGNIRELENLIERAVVLEPGETLSRLDLPGGASRRGALPGGSGPDGGVEVEVPLPVLTRRAIERLEREYLRRVLALYKGSIQRSADHAQINRRSFFAKMRAYGLRKEDFKADQ